MKILISYFYQIRFFKKNMIPLSTCLSDPKWFHKGYDKNYHYKDKNGVYNGLRAEPFVPIMEENGECRGREKCDFNFNSCNFLSNYYRQLKELDFEKIIGRFNRLGNYIKSIENFEEEPVMVLIVYETPNNPCSERRVIQKWFSENGYELKEFSK